MSEQQQLQTTVCFAMPTSHSSDHRNLTADCEKKQKLSKFLCQTVSGGLEYKVQVEGALWRVPRMLES